MATEVNVEQGKYALCFFTVAFEKSYDSCHLHLVAFASLKVISMNVFDTGMKILDTELFPQHNIANLNSGNMHCFVQLQAAFTMKENKHTHAHTQTHIQ